MTPAEVEAWLAGRSPERPAALAACMREAIAACPADRLAAAATMTEAMHVLGLSTLSTVTTDDDDRTALTLLAADAFVTYAFEAAADEGLAVAPVVTRMLTGVI